MMAFRQWILCGATLLTAIGCSGLNIKNCFSGERGVIEYTTVRVTCGQCKKPIAWYVGDDKDKLRKYVGNCTETNCSVQDKSAFRLHTTKTNSKNDSTLIILNISRMDTTVVSCMCGGLNNNETNRASCKLLIKVPISIVPGSCSVDRSGSKVYGVCTIQWLHLRDNITFICNWRLTYKSTSQDIAFSQEPSTNATHDFDPYKRRNCSFMADMPVHDGYYTYSIQVSSHPSDHFSRTFYIGNSQTHGTGVTYGIGAAAVILVVIAVVIIVCIVKRRTDIRNRKTQSPIVRYAAPSGHLYTIVITATEDHGGDEYITLPETIENDVPVEGSSNSPQSLQSTITSRRGVCYMNVTEKPNGSGFGVSEAPLKQGIEDTEPDTRVGLI